MWECVQKCEKDRKEWLSGDTYRKIEELRRKAKPQTLNDARSRRGKREANVYNKKNRYVKISCQRDKKNLIKCIARKAEDAGEKNGLRNLYMTTRKLSGVNCKQNRLIRSEDGALLKKMED